MSPIWRYLLAAAVIQTALAVSCDQCQGADCKSKSKCEGAYCVLTNYRSTLGNNGGEEEIVKGCIKNDGKLLSTKIAPHCNFRKKDKIPNLCICDTDNCTSPDKIKKLPKEYPDKVTCRCEGPHCNGKKSCKGDLCTYTKNHKTKAVSKGCMDHSIPLYERRAINSCMMPPMAGSMFYADTTKPASELLMIESCVCATEDCNAKKPVTYSDKYAKENIDLESCDFSLSYNYNGQNSSSPANRKCNGEFCFQTQIYSTDIGKLRSMKVQGCATFEKKSMMEVEFGKGQCSKYQGGGVTAVTCYKAKNAGALRRLEQSVTKIESREEEEENEEEYAEEEEEEEKPVKSKAAAKAEEAEEEEEEEEKEEKEEKKEEEEKEANDDAGVEGKKVETSSKSSNFVFVIPTEAPVPDESNATMITIFVLIILCICVAGITWKFQLHRKLMRGNYDTVAGG